mgnify:CR=1 FL=1
MINFNFTATVFIDLCFNHCILTIELEFISSFSSKLFNFCASPLYTSAVERWLAAQRLLGVMMNRTKERVKVETLRDIAMDL